MTPFDKRKLSFCGFQSVVNSGSSPTDTEGGTTVHLKNTPTEILLKDKMGPMEAIYEKILQAITSSTARLLSMDQEHRQHLGP